MEFSYDFRARGLVFADRTQIEQVSINLIKNACEAMARTSANCIAISTADAADSVTICITDTGPGVPKGLRLFEATVSGKLHGMGIGLPICRTIVEANGGRIWAERPERGARFCFSLPTIAVESVHRPARVQK